MKRFLILLIIGIPTLVLAQKPQIVAVFNQLGKQAVLNNDTAKAIYYFDKALALDSLNQIARTGYALTHKNLKAWQILSVLLAEAPADTNLHIVRAYCALNVEKQYKSNGKSPTQVNLWFGRTINDYQWLVIHNSHVNLTRANMDEAEAVWNGSYGRGDTTQKAVVPLVKDSYINTRIDQGYPALLIGQQLQKTTLNRYLQNELKYSLVTTTTYAKKNKGEILINYTFSGKKSGNKKNRIHLTYTLANKDSLIKKVSISGGRSALEEILISYWPTPAARKIVKQKRVSKNNLLTDKIVYTSYNPAMAHITVKHR